MTCTPVLWQPEEGAQRPLSAEHTALLYWENTLTGHLLPEKTADCAVLLQLSALECICWVSRVGAHTYLLATLQHPLALCGISLQTQPRQTAVTPFTLQSSSAAPASLRWLTAPDAPTASQRS